MKNPWKEICLSDYENHMSLDSVRQLQTLSAMMKVQFTQHPVKSVMILGIAGGNGLEHIPQNGFDCIYGVDINESYLAACQKRFPHLSDIFRPLCVDLTAAPENLPHAELLVANLLIEYIGYECFCRTVRLVAPACISCVIQVNTDDSFVSQSPYLHAFDALDSAFTIRWKKMTWRTH